MKLILMLVLVLFVSSLWSKPPEEKRLRIVVIDTGFNKSRIPKQYLCADSEYNTTNHSLKDVNGHGTNVMGIITKYIDHKTHCLTMIKFCHKKASTDPEYQRALKIAESLDPDFLNLSLSGEGFDDAERKILQRMANRGTVISVAAGNERNILDRAGHCDTFPACYKIQGKFHIVGSVDRKGYLAKSSNYGPQITNWEVGVEREGGGIVLSGTSMATAVLTGKLAGGYYEGNLNRRFKPIKRVANK